MQHTLTVHTPVGKARLVLAQKGRKFTVEDFEVHGRPELSLAFVAKGDGIENLDESSDARQCFGVSTRVRYQGVILDTLEMKANSIEELAYALKQVPLRAYSHEEI